jgi:RimJ/RimL family protein N-acetyltransferase/ribosomal protein S18 acetylase RimI-like enzyme
VIERIRAFRRAVEDRVAERLVPVAHGVGLFCDSIPQVYDENYVRIDRPVAAETHAAEADALMEAFSHRRVTVDGREDALTAGFAELGWAPSTHVVMAHMHGPDRIVPTNGVREVTLDDIAQAHRDVTLAESYGTPELADQLLEAKRRVGDAVRTRYFAVPDGDGIAAYCQLFDDGRTAQIEDVNTLLGYRGRGLGRAVVQRALEAAGAECDLVFLEALADDWPKDLYRKLGFTIVDERQLFLRTAHPLARLRIRTPRLELRLATVAELRLLIQVARDGIHDPGFMPFETAWTDELTDERFLDWHLSALRDWRPYDWRLELIVFHDGRPIGCQGLTAKQFGTTGRASTGSWLGAAWQGQGLGTEMRTGALTLLFDCLHGREAASGAIVGNDASLGVSRKLGYVETGMSTVSPRGTPVPHHDLVLAAERFRPPVPVQVDGFDGLDSYFGVDW